MDFFTREWQEYIYQEWGDFTNCGDFFRRCNYDKNEIEIYNDDYEVKLLEEFQKYYLAKKKYVEMANELFLKFGDYENVEIKSFQEELDEYKKRVDMYANKLYNDFTKVGIEDELEGLEEIDYKLLLLGYISKKNYSKLPKYYFNEFKNFKIFNFANVFLKGIPDYQKYLEKFIQKDIIKLLFHDGTILDVKREENNLTLLLSALFCGEQYITFVNYKVDEDLFYEWLNGRIYSNEVFYRNGKIYFYFEFENGPFLEIICDDIKIETSVF